MLKSGQLWLALVTLLVGAGLGSTLYAYNSGYRAAERDAAAQRVAAVEQAVAQARAQAAVDAAVLRNALEQEREVVVRTQYRTREVIRYVEVEVQNDADYHQCRLDDCGLCYARAAAGDTDPTACACIVDAAMPGAADAGREHGRAAGDLRGDSGPLSPVRGEGRRLDRVDGGRHQ